MGLLDAFLGNASANDANEIQLELSQLLSPGEQVRSAYSVIRDLMVFTNKRLILVDKQGVTGKKREYLTIPYRSIERFSMETTGHFDLEAELKIWVRGQAAPISKTFRDDKSIYDVYRALSEFAV
ncbi:MULTISPECIES: PH domain-containing protein [Hymenobacter]|uniref:PH domain-containing protein n=1 Tax=Hymenobacter mucosus TaxID=1411120 RepID=A0A238ZT83_9BACT|nr:MULTISPECIES: PH domain-containing protein [Hymenobacter]SNR86352.1 PH domain-containing protein [Hymenobacter mucosus]